MEFEWPRRMVKLADPIWRLVADDTPRDKQSAVIHPSDVTFLREHQFAVADSEGHRIDIFDLKSNKVSVLANHRVWPNCLCADRRGHLLVADRKTHRVQLWDVPTDTCIAEWGVDREEDEDWVWNPHGVAVNSKGQVIVTDTTTHAVYVFSPQGQLLHQFGSKGSDVQQLCLPFYCAVDSTDNIIVSDNLNYSVKVFDHAGNYMLRIGSGQDWGQRQFQCPYGVCADLDDNILVADTDSNRVFVHGPGGRFLEYVLTKADGCLSPVGLAVGPCGTMVTTECSERHANIKAYNLYGASSPVQLDFGKETRL